MTTTPPLLQLAIGGKVHTRRAPTLRPRESKLHVAVAKLLRDHCLPEWKWRWVPSKAQDAREGAIWKLMGAQAHWPDIELISPYGSVRFLELKIIGEELDGGQLDFRIWCIAHGIPHVVAHTIDEVLKTFDHWGCLRIRTSSVTYTHEELA